MNPATLSATTTPAGAPAVSPWREKYGPLILMTLVLAAAALVRIVFLFKDSFATGFDGYYYALQVNCLIRHGELLNNDNSIVYFILRLFALAGGDPVFSNKIASVALTSLAALPLWLLSRKLTGSLSLAAAAALFFAFSYSQVYMSFEILKNGISLLFAAGFLYSFFLLPESGAAKILAPLFFLLGFLTHKATAGVLIVFAVVYFISLAFIERRTLRDRLTPRVLFVVAALSLAIVLTVVFSLFTLRVVDLGNLLAQFSARTVFSRFEMFANEVTDLKVKVELFLLHLLPLVFIPFLIKKRKDPAAGSREKAFLLSVFFTHLFLINPFLSFSWVSMSYRLILISVLFGAIELAVMLGMLFPARRRRLGPVAAAAVMILSAAGLPGMYTRFHTDRYPPYAELAPAVQTLPKKLPPGSGLIAHPGLSFFIWYEAGIYTEHFLPDDNAGYWRLVYGIGPVHFRRYRTDPDYEEPQTVLPPYFLVKEKIWRLFYRDYQGKIGLLASWQNPHEKRPPFVYRVKEKFK